MLKYKNNKECENKDPKKFDLAKCNASLYENIINNKSLKEEIAKNTAETAKIKKELIATQNSYNKVSKLGTAVAGVTAAIKITKELIASKEKNIQDLDAKNISLQQQIAYNTEFLYRKRCIFMTFKEYNDEKVHINNNMFCYVFQSINEKDIKDAITNKLKDIKDRMLRPTTLKIPLPIYVMMAKRLEKEKDANIFLGNYEVILYIPNLYNYNKDKPGYTPDNALYTLFPSLDAFSKQNRWIELMTSKHSKYLDVAEIGFLKDSENKIKKKNFFRNDLTFSCLNMGCVSAEKDAVRIPVYSTSSSELSTNVEGVSPYLPKACLQTPYYNIQMMNLNEKDEARFRGSTNVLSDNFDIKRHCSPENMKLYEAAKEKDKDTFDNFLCTEIKKCDKYEGKKDPEYKDRDEEICDKPPKERIEDLMSYFYKKNFKPGTEDSSEYSSEYNNNILKEMAFRKSKYPGLGDDIQEIVFSMFRINEKLFDENLFCYMPWGNSLLKHDYVINEYDVFEIERVSFKSLNNVFEMKFHTDGYLYLYENNNRKSIIPNQSVSCNCYTKRVLIFENMVLNIYGYDKHNNYDLRSFVKLNNKSMYISPASLILSDIDGDLILYDLGVNNISA